MKSIKMLVLSTALLFSVASSAEGVEEICHRSAETNVTIKNTMNTDAGYLQFALDDTAKAKVSTQTKEQIRERLFYVHNRLNLSDTDLRRLSLVACLIKYK